MDIVYLPIYSKYFNNMPLPFKYATIEVNIFINLVATLSFFLSFCQDCYIKFYLETTSSILFFRQHIFHVFIINHLFRLPCRCRICLFFIRGRLVGVFLKKVSLRVNRFPRGQDIPLGFILLTQLFQF